VKIRYGEQSFEVEFEASDQPLDWANAVGELAKWLWIGGAERLDVRLGKNRVTVRLREAPPPAKERE
jgi:hypothetical protein